MVLFGYVVGHEGDHSQLGITGFVHAPVDKFSGFFPIHRVSLLVILGLGPDFTIIPTPSEINGGMCIIATENGYH